MTCKVGFGCINSDASQLQDVTRLAYLLQAVNRSEGGWSGIMNFKIDQIRQKDEKKPYESKNFNQTLIFSIFFE